MKPHSLHKLQLQALHVCLFIQLYAKADLGRHPSRHYPSSSLFAVPALTAGKTI